MPAHESVTPWSVRMEVLFISATRSVRMCWQVLTGRVVTNGSAADGALHDLRYLQLARFQVLSSLYSVPT